MIGLMGVDWADDDELYEMSDGYMEQTLRLTRLW